MPCVCVYPVNWRSGMHPYSLWFMDLTDISPDG